MRCTATINTTISSGIFKFPITPTPVENTLLENTTFVTSLLLITDNSTATQSYQCGDIFVLFPPECIKLRPSCK